MPHEDSKSEMRSRGKAVEAAWNRLSPKQREIAFHLATSTRPVPALSQELGCNPKTVRKHCESLFRTLGVASRQELVVTTIRWWADEVLPPDHEPFREWLNRKTCECARLKGKTNRGTS